MPARASPHPRLVRRGAPPVSLKFDRRVHVIIRSRSADGDVEDRVMVRPTAHGEGSPAVTTLYAREVVEDLELGVATGGNKAQLDREIERFGIDFQISTRLTSWVAVSARQMVDPRAPRRTETMPQALPFGMSAEGLGLRNSVAAPMCRPPSRSAAPMAPASMARMAQAKEADRSSVDDKTTPGSFGAMPPEDSPSSDPAEELSPSEAGMSPAPPRATGIAPARPTLRSETEPKRDAWPAKKKESLVDLAKRLRRPCTGEAQKDEAPQVPAPGRAPAAPEPAPPATRRLNGKVRRQGKRLIIEIDVTSTIKWAPAGEARLEPATAPS